MSYDIFNEPPTALTSLLKPLFGPSELAGEQPECNSVDFKVIPGPLVGDGGRGLGLGVSAGVWAYQGVHMGWPLLGTLKHNSNVNPRL